MLQSQDGGEGAALPITQIHEEAVKDEGTSGQSLTRCRVPWMLVHVHEMVWQFKQKSWQNEVTKGRGLCLLLTKRSIIK